MAAAVAVVMLRSRRHERRQERVKAAVARPGRSSGFAAVEMEADMDLDVEDMEELAPDPVPTKAGEPEEFHVAD